MNRSKRPSQRTCRHPTLIYGKRGNLAGMLVRYLDCAVCGKTKVSYQVIGRAK